MVSVWVRLAWQGDSCPTSSWFTPSSSSSSSAEAEKKGSESEVTRQIKISKSE